MALTTYVELKTSIGNWIHRTDTDVLVPDVVAMVEANLNNGFLFREMETTADLTVTAGGMSATLPTDYIAMKSVLISGSTDTVLEWVPDDKLLEYNASHTGGTPEFYNIRGSEILFSPYASEETTVTITYYQKIPSLETNGSNWLLAKAPHVYLYGSLFEITSFIMDDERAALFKAKYDEAVELLKKAKQKEQYSGSPIRGRSSYLV